MTKVINLMGAPGTGKSTVAAELFAKMKWLGYDVELVSEYAKELVWEERNETFKNELYLFGKQHHRMFRLMGKVEYIITDRPLILSLFYGQKYGNITDGFNQIVLDEVKRFNNINVFLERTKPYVTKGRNQTEEESDEFSVEMFELLSKNIEINMLLRCEQDNTSNEILNYISTWQQ